MFSTILYQQTLGIKTQSIEYIREIKLCICLEQTLARTTLSVTNELKKNSFKTQIVMDRLFHEESTCQRLKNFGIYKFK